MTENELRNKVCTQSRAWLGRKEADGSHREIIDLYNRHRPPGSYEMQYSDPWCAAFVSAVGMACGLDDVLLPHVNCDGMISAYKAKGRWVEADDYPAKPGDPIFYDWQDSGVGDNTGSADHVGLIVEDTEHYFRVIEGNYSNAVRVRTIAHNSRYIRGFAVPDYAGKSDNEKARSDNGNACSDNGTSAAVIVDKPGGAVSAAEMQQSVSNETHGLSFMPVLSQGSAGRSVVVAQGILIALGFSCGPDGADGEFGYNTRNATCRFQRANGLTVDGVIGPQTWAALLGLD